MRSANSRSGVIGDSARSSVTTNAASSTSPTANDADRRGVAPAVGGGVDEAVDERGHAERRGQRAGQVEAAVVALGLGQHGAAEHEQRDADRDVDEQHPAPRRPLGEHAAGDQADGAPPIETAV